jgi:hypothetical protein
LLGTAKIKRKIQGAPGGILSFLNQLKQQANALQNKQIAELQNIEANTVATEWACQVTLKYLQDLAKHLSIITPEAPRFSLDGKTTSPWAGTLFPRSACPSEDRSV